MADQSQSILCGIDVAKDELVIAQSNGDELQIPNGLSTIGQWLDSLPPKSLIAMEATGSYHEALLERAQARQHQVYLINGQQLNHYREAVGERAKTDSNDARLLLRYLEREHSTLTPVKPLNYKEKSIWKLLQRRATLVRAKTQITQSLASDPLTSAMTKEVTRPIEELIKRLDRQMIALAKELGWSEAIHHCQSIPGIGPLNALALVICFNRGEFKRSDKFVSYLGLDVRVRDSGQYTGRRKLSKRGNAEVRRLLYNAAMSFTRNPLYRPWYEQYRSRGLSSTAALMIVARKLVRIAFAVLSKGEDFDPDRFRKACMAT